MLSENTFFLFPNGDFFMKAKDEKRRRGVWEGRPGEERAAF